MSKTVKIRIDLQSNAEEIARVFGVSADKLKQASEGIATSSKRAGQALKDTAVTAASITYAINALQSATASLAAAYQVQEQAETQLATVMRERMSATELQIQGIKDLASAQQQLGVIGDEVQLAGAQQVATFLKSEAALRVLLPAMNDLIAQQKGLNATSGDAVNIANLFGKAMTGQIGALRRVGITFDDTQAAVMKNGTEMERASMLAEIVTQNVGHMNAELAKTSSGQVKQVANALGDVQEQLGAFAVKAQPYIAFASSTVVLTNGVRTLAAALVPLAARYVAWTVKVFDNTTALITNRSAVTGVGLATRAATVATRAWAVSMRVLSTSIKAALVSTGIGAIIVGISIGIEALIDAFSDAGDEADKMAGKIGDATTDLRGVAAGQEAFSRASEQAGAAVIAEAANLKALMDANLDTSKAVSELNSRYGDIFDTWSTAAEWYDVLTKKATQYATVLGSTAQLQTLGEERMKYMGYMDKLKKDYPDVETYKPQPRDPSKPLSAAEFGRRAAKAYYDQYKQRIDEIDAEINRVSQAAANAQAELKPSGTKAKTPSITPSRATAAETRQKEYTPAKSLGQYYTPDDGWDDWIKKSRTVDTSNLTEAIVAADRWRRASLLSLDEIGEAINFWTDRLNAATSDVGRNGASHQLQRAKDKQAYMQRGVSANAAAVKASELVDGDLTTALSAFDTSALSDLRDAMADALDWGGLADSAADDVRRVIEAIDQMAPSVRDSGGSAAQVLSGVGRAMSTLSSITDKGAAAWLNYASGIINAVAAAIPAITAMATAKGVNASQDMPFPANIAALAATLAAVGAAIASIPKFAEGGIAYGKTLGIFGEYAGASHNPEVVAPLDRLRTLIGGTNSIEGGTVRVEIEGHKLVGFIRKEINHQTRIG